MELGTFGAVLGFGMEIEAQAETFYQAQEGQPFAELARESHKRLQRLERARREGVTEMILESITGLDSDDYRLEIGPEVAEANPRLYALALEERAQRFYQEAAKKMPVRGVARLLQRMVRENERRQELLQEA